MRKLLTLIIGLSLCSISYAQPKSSKIYTINKTYNTIEELPALFESEKSYFNGQYFVIMQSDGLTLNMKDGAIKPLEYLPYNTFIASINANSSSDLKAMLFNLGYNESDIRAIPSEIKLSKRLYENNIPDWAWVNGNQIKVWLRYYNTLTLKKVAAAVIDEGYEIIESRENENLLAIAYTPGDYTALTDLPFVQNVQEMEDPGEAENEVERQNHRVNTLQSNQPNLPYYDGSGVKVGLGDDGEIGPHADYAGRLVQQAGTSQGDHGDHVAGTIFGAGNINPAAKGMAPGAEIFYQSYPNNLNDADQNYANLNVRITSSSYSNGCNAGYTNFTRQMDEDAAENPFMLHVFSAGNSNNSNCGYGAGNQWGNVTGGHKIAKNVVAVANITNTNNIASSSSRGPASDGRIKPDVSAVGTNVYSTTNPDSYTTKTGTSMSCPGVSGSLAVLYEAYKDKNNGNEPIGTLLKGILMNSCDDLGNTGPDFIYGYGRINVRKAYEIIDSASYSLDSVSTGTTKNLSFTVPANTSQAKIMLIWADPEASTSAQFALINDLDLTVSTPGGADLKPWVLDHTPTTSALSTPAIRARDSLNNVEQVTIDNPTPGTYTVNVNGFNVPSGTQKFYVLYYYEETGIKITYPNGGEVFSPSTQEVVRLDASPSGNTMATAFSLDGGATFINSTSGIAGNRTFFNFGVPNFVTDSAMIRIIRGNDTAYSGMFTILGNTGNINFTSICPDSLTLSWTAVNGATGYVVYALGSMYMDSVTYSDTTVATIVNNPTTTTYISVAPVINSIIGNRAIAELKPEGVSNCIVPNDIALDAILSPADGYMPDCFNFNGLPVTVRIINTGTDSVNASLTPITVNYTFNGGATVTENITSGILAPGDTLVYSFNGTLSLAPNITYSTSSWLSLSADANNYNDSLAINTEIYSGQSQSVAFLEDFETFNNCNVNPDCGATICTLANGWVNASNGGIDDIDWRTNNGGTASAATGPSSDFTTGINTGKYLYLESSGSCEFNEAHLISPCLSLSNSTSPLLSFYYHMYGADMGTLNVDIFDGIEWHNSIMPELSGNQGNSWREQTIDLSAFSGDTILIRFRGVTGADFTSDIAIDNIEVKDTSKTAPVVAFSNNSGNESCIGDTVIFTSQTTGATSYLWNFGPNAFPQTDTTAGPVAVIFTGAGTTNVTLNASNNGGTAQLTQSINVKPLPNASFAINPQNLTVSFTNQSTGNPTSYFWDFGNGDTSTALNPSVTYDSLGTYDVSLLAINECGTDTFSLSVNLNTINLQENNLAELSLYPNPSHGVFTLSGNHYLAGAYLRVTDMNGKLINTSMVSKDYLQGNLAIDLTTFPAGVYVLQIENDYINQQVKLVKQ